MLYYYSLTRTVKKIITLIALILIIFSCSDKTDNIWEETSQLSVTWIKLERGNKGYMIYDPCDGNNSFFDITKNDIIYDLSQ